MRVTKPYTKFHHVRKSMQKTKKNTAKGKAEKPRVSAAQRKIRRQQVTMGTIGVILILAMVLALTIK